MRHDLARRTEETKHHLGNLEPTILGLYSLGLVAGTELVAEDTKTVVSSQNYSEAKWLQSEYLLRTWIAQ